MGLIYEPAEDSFLFMDFLEDCFEGSDVSGKSVLDMGCGSCILSETLKDLGFEDVLCVDVNADAVKLAKGEGFRAIESDLFNNVDERFDYIVFNAPYLPKEELEDEESMLATTGGERGDEVVIKFLEQVKDFLNENGKVYVLVSSLTSMDKINEYKPEVVAKKNVFFEELKILKFVFR